MVVAMAMAAMFAFGALASSVWRDFRDVKHAQRRADSFPFPIAATLHDTIECRKAVHEAGHTIAVWLCTIVDNIAQVTIDAPTGGHVTYSRRSSGDVESTPVLWCDLVVAMAGVAAECVVFGRTRSGHASRDLAHARGAFEELARREVRAPPWRPRQTPALPFEAMYEQAPNETELAVLRQAYAMARSIVCTHRRMLDLLVGHLLVKRTLTGAEVADVLGTRRLVKCLGMFGPTFVMPMDRRVA